MSDSSTIFPSPGRARRIVSVYRRDAEVRLAIRQVKGMLARVLKELQTSRAAAGQATDGTAGNGQAQERADDA